MTKTIKSICILITFSLCFPLHFLYDFFPNTLFSIFLPVNESIWEHMKLIYTSYFICGLLECLYYKISNLKVNNFSLQLFIVPIIGIILYLILFIPIYNSFGENLFIALSLLLIVIIIENIISYYLLKLSNYKHENIIGILGILLSYIIFMYLTYFPIKNEIFYDTIQNKYGINIYN